MLLFITCRVCFQTVLSGDVYSNMSFLVDMMDVSLELLDRPKPTQPSRSLARSVLWQREHVYITATQPLISSITLVKGSVL